MIDLWYLNISEIGVGKFGHFLNGLPLEMQAEIMRFQVFKDRCLKLFGKLMVQKYHLDNGLPFNWSNWKTTTNGKPYCADGKLFNISHSGDFVSVAFSNENIGVDIEILGEVDVAAIADFLHPDEIEFIDRSADQKDAFYRIWTRKEAYLKARGIGIVQGLNNESCLNQEMQTDERWFVSSMDFIRNYKVAVCSPIPNPIIQKRQLEPTDFLVL